VGNHRSDISHFGSSVVLCEQETASSFAKAGGILLGAIEEGAGSIFYQIPSKIISQMGRRIWSRELIHEVVNCPLTTRAALNEPLATRLQLILQKKIIMW
jgi:hypothetical protein